MKDAQQQESLDGSRQLRREEGWRVERADLALREERKSPKYVGCPERQLSSSEGRVQQRKDRVEEREGVRLGVDPRPDQ
jgi:hypothetical protein